jgi:hypothetical protein
MIRKASLQAYEKIQKNGLLPKRRFQVYDWIWHHGPCTAAGVFRALDMKTNQSGRFTELEKQGVIEEVGRTEDADTGMIVTLWDVTQHLPIDFMSSPARKEWKRDVLEILSQADQSTWIQAIDEAQYIIDKYL